MRTRIKMSKTAQIKMAENVGVLVIFFVLVAISFIFYFAYQRGSIQEQVDELKTRNAVELAARVALMPELQCRADNVLEDHCFDKIKLAAGKLLFSTPDKEDYYYKILGYSTIKISSIYPSQYSLEIYHKQKPSFTNNDTFMIPVSLYNPISGAYDYGLLQVSVYG
jgi:preprotein translocase subunit YajC